MAKDSTLSKYVTLNTDGRFKYLRRVPDDCQDTMRRKMWNLSLGRVKDAAEVEAFRLRALHDAEIAALRNPATAQSRKMEVISTRVQDRIATMTAAGVATGDGDTTHDPDARADDGHQHAIGEMWRRVPQAMATAESNPDPKARENAYVRLLTFAFGDQSRATVEGLPTFPPPSGGYDLILYNTHKKMLTDALEALAPMPTQTPPELLLSGLVKSYLKLNDKLSDNTVKSYRNKTARLIDCAGDLALSEYDAKALRGYRDYLKAGDAEKKLPPAKASTINQYFACLKTIWKYAATEHEELATLTFPNINLGKDRATVEETRWQAFDEDQIKLVWQLVSTAWSPEAESKLSQSRRKAFLMAIRVLLYTGMRPAEVFHLKAGDLKDGILSIKYTKTRAQRKIPLSIHIADDFKAFLEAGGFEAELEAGRTAIFRGKPYGKPTKPESLAGSLSDNFAPLIRAGGLTSDRHVLYSLKDTLVSRLQHLGDLGVSDDLMRAVIGHVGGQGKLRHYKEPFDRTAKGLEAMRKALNAIVYW